MRKLFLLLLILSTFTMGGFTQDINRMRAADRLIMGVFTDFWSGLPDGLKQRSVNRGVIFEYLHDYPLGTTNLSVAGGLGFTSHNLYTDHLYYDINATGNHEFIPVTQVYSPEFRNNKISLNYLHVPLELRYRTRNLPQTLRLHAGIRAGWLLSAHTKYVGEVFPGGRQTLRKEKRLTNIENFLVGVHGRVGYGRFNFNTYMSLTDIFKNNNASEASLVSVGVSFILF
jgi:hypothetical protein